MPLRSIEPNKITKLSKRYQKLLNDPDETSQSYVRIGQHGDGSCFFCSICYAMNHDNYRNVSHRKQRKISHKYRKKFTEHISEERLRKFCQHHNIYPPIDEESFKEQFQDTTSWADENMIKWTSEVLRKNIVFVDAETAVTIRGGSSVPQLYCGVKNVGETIIVLWVMRKHFELIGKKAQSDLTTLFPEDHYINTQYKNQCER